MQDDTPQTGQHTGQADIINCHKLLSTAYKLQALSKVLADWLCNNSAYSERGEHDPNSGDMITLSSLLVGECIALVELLDNPSLEVQK